jgi:ADP-ribosylarginine hydrolase
VERDAFYKKLSFDGWGGSSGANFIHLTLVVCFAHTHTALAWRAIPASSGHDSVIIAYDALLSAGSSWNELLLKAALHAGDSDSTGR